MTIGALRVTCGFSIHGFLWWPVTPQSASPGTAAKDDFIGYILQTATCCMNSGGALSARSILSLQQGLRRTACRGEAAGAGGGTSAVRADPRATSPDATGFGLLGRRIQGGPSRGNGWWMLEAEQPPTHQRDATRTYSGHVGGPKSEAFRNTSCRTMPQGRLAWPGLTH